MLASFNAFACSFSSRVSRNFSECLFAAFVRFLMAIICMHVWISQYWDGSFCFLFDFLASRDGLPVFYFLFFPFW